jgi:tRNA threonylcarbamoyladenosine biosynthesis protein TsaE
MATLISRSPEETLAIGEAWGREAQRGWVIGLTGDLGAGKTQLVKGIARGLGCEARVHSPTFALLNEYTGGRLRIFHIDLYRLDSRADVLGAGLDDYLVDPDGITVVEWIERWGAQNRDGITRIARIEATSETERRITIEESGT